MAISRPSSDVSIGAWTDQSGGTSNLYTSINETTLDLTHWVQVVSAPLSGDPDLPATFQLTAAAPLAAGEAYRIALYADASYASGLARPLFVELLDGVTVKDSTTFSVNNSAVVLLSYVVSSAITSISSPRLRFTLRHDGTDWRADVYQAFLGIVYAHPVLATDGWNQVELAAAGGFLSIAADGWPVTKSGTEDETGAVLASDGWLQTHG